MFYHINFLTRIIYLYKIFITAAESKKSITHCDKMHDDIYNTSTQLYNWENNTEYILYKGNYRKTSSFIINDVILSSTEWLTDDESTEKSSFYDDLNPENQDMNYKIAENDLFSDPEYTLKNSSYDVLHHETLQWTNKILDTTPIYDVSIENQSLLNKTNAEIENRNFEDSSIIFKKNTDGNWESLSERKNRKRKQPWNQIKETSFFKPEFFSEEKEPKIAKNTMIVFTKDLKQISLTDPTPLYNQDRDENILNHVHYIKYNLCDTKNPKANFENKLRRTRYRSDNNHTKINGIIENNITVINEEMIKNIETLYNSDLLNKINIKNVSTPDNILLTDKKELSDAILNLENNYMSKKKKDQSSCFIFKSDISLENFDLEDFEKRALVVLEYIENKHIKKQFEIQAVLVHLNFLSNRVIDEVCNLKSKKSCLLKTSAEVYWEVLKTFVDISEDPLFSVILPEFSTFNLKNNINYFKNVENINFYNILKFKLILKAYHFLFFKINKMKNGSLENLVSLFVFNSRYYLRRNLICCFIDIWEENILKLYIKIICHNIDKNTEEIELMSYLHPRHEIICKNKVNDLDVRKRDDKELLMRFFFQIDVEKFRCNLNERFEIEEYKEKINKIQKSKGNIRCFFTLYLFTKSREFSITGFLRDLFRATDFYLFYYRTCNIYVYKSKDIIDRVFEKYDMKIEKELDRIYELKEQSLIPDFSTSNKSTISKIFSLKKNAHCQNEHIKFFIFFEDESIRNL